MLKTIEPNGCLIEQYFQLYPEYTRDLLPEALASIVAICGDAPVYIARQTFTSTFVGEPQLTCVHASLSYLACLDLLGDTLIHDHLTGGIAGWKAKEIELELCRSMDAPPSGADPVLVLKEKWKGGFGEDKTLAWEIFAGTADDVAKAVHKKQFRLKSAQEARRREQQLRSMGESMLP